MANGTPGLSREAQRRMLAYAEELMLLKMEQEKIRQQILTEELKEQAAGSGQVLNQMEKEMTDLGIIAPQHDV